MTQKLAGVRSPSQRATKTLIFAGVLLTSAFLASEASAQALGYAAAPQGAFPSDNLMPESALGDDGNGSSGSIPARLQRAVVSLDTHEAAGTIIIDTGNTALYYVLGQGRAIRYGVGVGREGFTWSGTQTITRKAAWPDWHPPAQMIARQPYLPRFMAGGPGNPLGARAMYLGSSDYRIHGTNDPSTIGKFVSSGCIRLTNEDVTDLFSRVDVGAKVVVLAKNAPHLQARAATPLRASSGRQAMNLSTVSIH